MTFAIKFLDPNTNEWRFFINGNKEKLLLYSEKEVEDYLKMQNRFKEFNL